MSVNTVNTLISKFACKYVSYFSYEVLSAERPADAHFASKNTLLKTHTLLLKTLTHFAAKNTWQDTLYSTAHLAP